MGDARVHWDKVYADKGGMSVSWYQPHSVRSLALIDQASPARGASMQRASVIDVGGGAATLVDDLLARGFADVAVLDIAATALERSKARLGKNAGRVAWLVADVTHWTPARTWDIWHDRAVFHFLMERPQQDAYIAALTAATRPGATVILSTFDLDGPERCSGLPVQRYNASTLAARLGAAFEIVNEAKERHTTPQASEQRFSYAVLKRR
jgi:2-polyprenyl-3-methyl-5-hydroxy-6-metoxy-1,4-benzoquinol methylase